MEEEMHVKYEQVSLHEYESVPQNEINEYDPMSDVWVKQEVLVKQETNDLGAEIKRKLTSYLEKHLTSSDLCKKDEISEEHEPITQVCINQEIKQKPYDLSQAVDKEELNIPDSPEECIAENENADIGEKGESVEETELPDVKSVCHSVSEKELSATDVHESLESTRMKYCWRQSKLLGKVCGICKKPTLLQIWKYKCDICDKQFARKAEFRSHLSVHREGKFRCDICWKDFGRRAYFRRKAYLNIHRSKVHSDERKILCPTCGKGFKTHSVLKRHRVLHG